MYGLFGALQVDGQSIDLVQAGKALNLLRYRGPDDEGWLLLDNRSGSHKACRGLYLLVKLCRSPYMFAS